MYARRGLYTLEINVCTYPYKNKDKLISQTHIEILKYLMSRIQKKFHISENVLWYILRCSVAICCWASCR